MNGLNRYRALGLLLSSHPALSLVDEVHEHTIRIRRIMDSPPFAELPKTTPMERAFRLSRGHEVVPERLRRQGRKRR